LPNEIRIKSRIRLAKHVAWIGNMGAAYRVLVGNPEGKNMNNKSLYSIKCP
jgi:hypothetical protein